LRLLRGGFGGRFAGILVKVRSRLRRRPVPQLGGATLLGEAAQLGVEIERVLFQIVKNVDDAGALIDAVEESVKHLRKISPVAHVHA